MGNKSWEQILRLDTNKIFKQIWGTKYGKKIGPLNFFLLEKWRRGFDRWLSRTQQILFLVGEVAMWFQPLVRGPFKYFLLCWRSGDVVSIAGSRGPNKAVNVQHSKKNWEKFSTKYGNKSGSMALIF